LNTYETTVEDELACIARRLGDCLTQLDGLGAGIAAIHVNAAIEHLAALGEEAAPGFGAASVAIDSARADDKDRPGTIDWRLLGILSAMGRPH
jgi:hypothetical protein